MRLSISFFTAVAGLGFLCGAVSANSPAQQGAAGLLDLRVGQIRQQEAVVSQAAGKDDGEAWLKLAVLRQDAAQYAESEAAYHRAVALLRSGDRMALADALDHMGTMYVERGKFAKAEPLERKALAMREAAKDELGIGVSHMHLSALELGRHDYFAAEADAAMAVSLLAPEKPIAMHIEATPEEQMTALINLSLARSARGGSADAVVELRRALEIAHAHYAAESVPVGFLDFLLGNALWKSGDTVSGGEQMRSGIRELETQLGWGHPTYLQALHQYEGFLTQTEQATEAAEVSARIARLERPKAKAEAGLPYIVPAQR